MSFFFGWSRLVCRSYRPRPLVVPTRVQPDALYKAPVKRGVSTKVGERYRDGLVSPSGEREMPAKERAGGVGMDLGR